MNHAIEDLLDFSERLRKRIDTRIDFLKRRDRTMSVQQQFIDTWAIALMILAWDISDSILTMARNGNHVRAIQILTRSLFEYATRLEFYAYFPESAVEHGLNSRDWLAKVVQKNSYRYDLDNLESVQRASLEELLDYEYKVLQPQFYQMLQQMYQKRGYSEEEIIRSLASQYNDFYAAASALSHGSQGIFPEIFYKDEAGFDARHKAIDSDMVVVLKNTVGFLLRLNYSFCKHYTNFDDDDIRGDFARRFNLVPEE